MPPVIDPLRAYLAHVGQVNIHPAVTDASYRLYLNDPEAFLAHASARAAELDGNRPEPLRLLSHTPEARAAARAERDQKQRLSQPAPPRVLRSADGRPMTTEGMGDTEYARALQRGAQHERELKERLRRQTADFAARRAAAEAAGDVLPEPTPEQQAQHMRDVERARLDRATELNS